MKMKSTRYYLFHDLYLTKMQGQWRDGLRHGRALYVNGKGQARLSFWEEDRLVSWERDGVVLSQFESLPPALSGV